MRKGSHLSHWERFYMNSTYYIGEYTFEDLLSLLVVMQVLLQFVVELVLLALVCLHEHGVLGQFVEVHLEGVLGGFFGLPLLYILLLLAFIRIIIRIIIIE